ncbi:lipocalin family protein [Nocardia cyriacigeorgica]|uniref:Lipocalin family protein n=1 Tax=Nocardia cyriacigeorgica TaxID=135487 RepID=A0A6P1D9P1_9NOCA|nr:lipocalin family protein [Nocardia cyriacigeorgica]NEW46828.1 lipocalin family protein [Nocardia cyriacigeorgica]
MARVAAATVLACAVSAGTVAAAPTAGWQPLMPVAALDVQRYLGTWNQVAAVPQPFNLECARDTVANYQLIDANNVRVENSCVTWSGGTNRIVGNARVVDPVSRAQLHVSFPRVPFQDSLDGPPNYVVTFVADDYSWAVLGDPLRLSGFVLSRSTAVDAARWREIRAVVADRGYDPCVLLTSPAVGGAADIRPLCTV